MKDLKELKDIVVNKPLEQSVVTIDQTMSFVNEVSDILLQGLDASEDRFIYTERISVFFGRYLEKLKSLLEGKDLDLAFWAASLLIHYKINDSLAESVLLDAIEFSDNDDHVSTATVILCRNRNQKVIEVINKRLNSKNPEKKMRDYFIEKINDLTEALGGSV
ncbi:MULTISPECIES: hypothetical protein [Niastella]|uniref:Immunity protein 30 domain-containing protein n=1 Tax=Niastella soli TaxID=2821487 RepID=A0ABS3YW83_9BACT|nr:hypothetical protein [Niastella soli]MBO9202148.1 hypothetical protein [Niastella soli]